jgi:hypothetical protein
MAIAASAPVLQNQKKTVLQNHPIYWRTLYIFTEEVYRLLSVFINKQNLSYWTIQNCSQLH